MERGPLLRQAVDHAVSFLEGLSDRDVQWSATVEELRDSLGGPLPESPTEPSEVLAQLVKGAERGIVGIPGGRYFGFVIGGGLPAALAADVLVSAWDQNAGLYVGGPAASVVEEVSGEWLRELFGLPQGVSFGFVTGGQMANFTGLAAARYRVLSEHGWDVERDGLAGGPPIRVIAGDEHHVTVTRALRFLGLGSASVVAVPSDDQGRMRVEGLRSALEASDGPTIVCAQVGNVNTGAMDPIAEICDLAHEAGAWVHVDGAFGLWAAASPALRPLVEGVERADSWATDGHKWLNVPYDSGFVFCAHPSSHRDAMTAKASYLIQAEQGRERDEVDWNPEFSRRARGFPVYAAVRSLGRSGIAEMIERCCGHARRFGEALAASPDVHVLNDVVLNQVLVRFLDPDGDHDRRTRAVVEGVQREGTCWLSGTTWHGMAAMRISVSNWSTTTEDVDRSIEAIQKVAAGV